MSMVEPDRRRARRTGPSPTAVALLGLLTLGAAPPSVPVAPQEAAGYDVEDCVEIALATNAQIEEAEAKVAEWSARLREVESTFYPKLQGLAFVAPMFTVPFNDIRSRQAVTRWESIEDWGPYTNLQARLVQPIFTFGRVAAGEEAATERIAVEQARLRETRNTVAREVRRLYYLHLYAASMLPSLEHASQELATAQEKAQELYDQGTGEVTQIDLAKIAWGQATVAKFQVRARYGAELALRALRQAMGWTEDRPLVLAEDRLPRTLPEEDPSLPELLREAAENRPEWDQIRHGKRASLALAEAEFLSNMPVLALAAQVEASWTPTVENSDNFYHFDPFNRFFAGIALAIQFDIDPWAASAREDAALALHDQIDALHRFATTGIPLQVRQAHMELTQSREVVEISHQATVATRRWLTFAATAFASGTGEAQDVLEGLAAYLEAKNGEYEALRDYFLALANLDYAVGRARRP